MYRLKGDHRAFHFDIGEEFLFGKEQTPVYETDGRAFRSNDPKAVTTYLKAVHKHLDMNNVFHRIKKLMASDIHNHEEAERLDREMLQACAHGSNQCKKRKQDYWSIDLHTLKRN
jgi:hypothetical protein